VKTKNSSLAKKVVSFEGERSEINNIRINIFADLVANNSKIKVILIHQILIFSIGKTSLFELNLRKNSLMMLMI
jgi:hypothetical protein